MQNQTVIIKRRIHSRIARLSSIFLKQYSFFKPYGKAYVNPNKNYNRRSETNQYESLLNASNEIIWSVGPDLNIITANNKFYSEFNCKSANINDEAPAIFEPIGSENYQKWVSFYNRSFRGENFSETVEFLNPQKNTLQNFSVSFNPICNNSNSITGVACFAKEVTGEILELEKLTKAKDTLSKIMDSSLDLICTVDEEGYYVSVSAASERILGYKPEELIGKLQQDYIYHEDFEKTKAAKSSILQDHVLLNFENRYVHKNGSVIPLVWTSRWNPEVGLRFGVARDATEKIKAEAELKNSETMLAEAQRIAKMGSWSYDFRFDKLTRSEELYNLFGVNRSDFDNKPWSFQPLIDEEYRDFLYKTMNHFIESGESYKIEFNITTPKGEKKILEESGFAKKDENGKLINLLGTVQDITQRKVIENRLKELNENLENQKQALEISNKELEQFAYIASHDLQEPLRMVAGFVSLLSAKYSTALDDKAKDYINYALDGTKRMRQLISDLLEYSRVGQIDESLVFINLNDLLSDVKVLFRNQIEESHAKISWDNLPNIKAHKSPLRQVFQNLIGNALKYCRQDVIPEITISCRAINSFYEFSVKDNGIGIDQKYFEKIFLIFQRLHSKSMYSGTGLGLAITKKIVESFGGNIWVESTLNEGSTFYFTLPTE